MNRLLEFFYNARKRRRLHLTGIDPCCHDLDRIGDIALAAARGGTDAFLLGGSDGVSAFMVEQFAVAMGKALKENLSEEIRPPVILFPSSAETGLAKSADGVLFLCVLNSSEVRFLVREQMKAAPHLKKAGLEAIGCGMILTEPGGTVGRVTRSDLLNPNDVKNAVGYAAAAQAFGFPLFYINAGSGSDKPVSTQIIEAVSESTHMPLIIGGGLVDADKVHTAVQAGADIVVTGSAVEYTTDVFGAVVALAEAVHSVPPKDAS